MAGGLETRRWNCTKSTFADDAAASAHTPAMERSARPGVQSAKADFVPL
jgi:hypothetical protein